MRRYWTIPLTIVTALLVAFVVARDVALPYTEEGRQKAVAQLQEKIAARLPVAPNEKSAAPQEEKASADVQEVPAPAPTLPNDVSSVLEKSWEVFRDISQANRHLLYSYEPWEKRVATAEEVDALCSKLAEHEAFLNEAFTLCSDKQLVHSIRASDEKLGLLSCCLGCVAMRAEIRVLKGELASAMEDITLVCGARNGFGLNYNDVDLAIMDAIRAVLAKDAPDFALADKLAATFRDYHSHAFFADQFARLLRGTLRWLSRKMPSTNVYENVVRWGYRTAFRPIYNHDVENYSAAVQRMLDVVDLPFYQTKPVLLEIQKGYSQGPISRPVNCDGLYCYFAQQAHFETLSDIIDIVVAVHKYQRQHGSCPDDLDAVADLLGGSVPVEPSTGLPFTYRKKAEGFEIEAHAPVQHTQRWNEFSKVKWE